MEDYKHISDLIVRRRKFLGLTQQALALRAGVSLRSLKSVESAEGNPSFMLLTRILNLLGMKLHAVIR